MNRDEYDILKPLATKWRWIARDKSGNLEMYKEKPIKEETFWRDPEVSSIEVFKGLLGLPEDFYSFIQWEDEEPYRVTNLIEEYEEHKEGEIDLPKGIDWLDKEIFYLLDSYDGLHSPTNRAVRKALFKVLRLVKQVDEPETASNIEFLKEKVEIYEEMSNNIEENTSYNLGEIDIYSGEDSIKIVKKPTIPKFIGDWIEENQGLYPYDVLGLFEVLIENDIEYQMGSEVLDWVRESHKNKDDFAIAWRHGYKVEEGSYIISFRDGNKYLENYIVSSVNGTRISSSQSKEEAVKFDSKEKAEQISNLIHTKDTKVVEV